MSLSYRKECGSRKAERPLATELRGSGRASGLSDILGDSKHYTQRTPRTVPLKKPSPRFPLLRLIMHLLREFSVSFLTTVITFLTTYIMTNSTMLRTVLQN